MISTKIRINAPLLIFFVQVDAYVELIWITQEIIYSNAELALNGKIDTHL
jgi:hypothetical protein